MIPSWAVAGSFVVCTSSRWNTFSGRAEDVVENPPRRGNVYTLSGSFVAPPGRVALILAEYPNLAFDISNFAPSPLHYYPLFRLMQSATFPIVETDITIKNKGVKGPVRWVV